MTEGSERAKRTKRANKRKEHQPETVWFQALFVDLALGVSTRVGRVLIIALGYVSARKDDAVSDRQPLASGSRRGKYRFLFRKRRSTVSISLTPLEDKIIVKQAEAETQTASGLFIPDNAKEKPQQGEVLAVGPGRRNDAGERIPVDVKVGDKVLYSKYGGTEVHYQGEDYLIVSSRDILAILG